MNNIALDKQLHFFATGMLFSMLYIFTSSYPLAASLTLGIGIVKEVVYDGYLGKGTRDVWDVVANAAGLAVMSLVVLVS